MDAPDSLNDQLTNIAEAIPVDDAALSLVAVRDTLTRRRRRRSVIGGVLGAAVLVGGIVVVGALTGDSGSDTIAIDGPTEEAPADTEAPVETVEGAIVDDTIDSPPSDDVSASSRQVERVEATPTAISIGGPSGGETGDWDQFVEWVVPWQDGFLAGRSSYVSQPLPTELPEDVAALFPQEVLDLFADGLPATINEATAMLSEAGLLDEVTDVLAAHPEASEVIYSADVPDPSADVVFSTDGTTWEPIDVVIPDGVSGLYGIQSTGDRLAVATQIFEEPASFDLSTRPDQVGRIVVATTTDLVNWDITDVDAGERPADLPDVYTFGVSPGTLAANDDGWLLSVHTFADVDFESLLPEALREQLYSGRGGYGTSSDESGVIVEIYDDMPADTTAPSDDVEPTFTEPTISETLTFSWEELGVDPGVLDRVDGPGQSVFFARWDGTPTEVEVDGWTTAAASDGFYSGSGDSLDYSVDGVDWTPLALPADGLSVTTIKALDSGALVFVNDDTNATKLYRVSGATGEWQQLEHPDFPAAMNDIFGNDSSTSALLVDGHEPVVVEPTEITVEADGFTMVMREDGAEVSVRVTDPSGDVVADETFDWRSGDQPTTWRYGNTGLKILDAATGETIVTFGNSVMEAAYRAQTDRYEQFDQFDPDLFLIATTDGDRWLIEDLDVSMNDASFGPGGLALNGTTLLVNAGDGWERYDLS